MAHKRTHREAPATEEPTGGAAWVSAWGVLLVIFVVLGVVQARMLLAGADTPARTLSSGLALNAAIVLLCLGQMLRPRVRRIWRWLLPPSLVLLGAALYLLLVRP